MNSNQGSANQQPAPAASQGAPVWANSGAKGKTLAELAAENEGGLM